MCGIAGFCDFNSKISKDTLVKMTDVLQHRGPDDSGYYFSKNNYATIGLGHRRLSIIDLSPLGHQPMKFKDWIITYNGEVYNFNEIKIELEEVGYKFVSSSDTEVILKSIDYWGLEAINKFIGMFAFALYNSKLEVLYLVRDRTGIKPLYYYYYNSVLLFSSELKSFHEWKSFPRELDVNNLGSFLQYGYIPVPHSIFKNTFKLKPGYILKINLKLKKLSEIKYWDVFDLYERPKLKIDEDDVELELERMLIKAFEYRMVADVPVGVFLSGGFDSSIVTAILQKERTEKIKTFTIGFEDKRYNEAEEAKKIASFLGTEHTEYYFNIKDVENVFEKFSYYYDEPFGDKSGLPTSLVSKIASKELKVVLSADGGDEIFAGYNKYFTQRKLFEMYLKIPIFMRKIISASTSLTNWFFNSPTINIFHQKTNLIRRILLAHSDAEIMQYKIEPSYFFTNHINNLLVAKHSVNKNYFDEFSKLNTSFMDKMLAIDYKTYLCDDILTKVDRATMRYSLEGREPLLDHNIIDFVSQLPTNFKFREFQRKYILKNITYKYIPENIINRPKRGFDVPLNLWLRGQLKYLVDIYLDPMKIKNDGIFDHRYLEKYKKYVLKNKNADITALWFLIVFQQWKENWL